MGLSRYPTRGMGRGFAFLQEHLNDADGACLIWPLFRDKDSGYGRLGHCGGHYYAHRFMCELANGPAPSDKHEASHSCGRGHDGCVHPRHLTWKTPSDNQKDRRQHGTAVTSIWGNHGKLSQHDKDEIIKLKDYLTQREIGKLFGLPFQTVSRVQLEKPKVRKLHRWLEQHDRILIEGKRRGDKPADLAARIGVSERSTYSRINRLKARGRIPNEGVQTR